MVDAGVNTGGAPGAGCISRLGAAKPKVTAERNLDTIARRISISTPVLQWTYMDGALWRLLLTELIKQEVHDSRAIVMPMGALLHQVDEGVFDKYRSTLERVTQATRLQCVRSLESLVSMAGAECCPTRPRNPLPPAYIAHVVPTSVKPL